MGFPSQLSSSAEAADIFQEDVKLQILPQVDPGLPPVCLPC